VGYRRDERTASLVGMTTTHHSSEHPQALAGFDGEVLYPNSAAYDDARRVWNHAIDRYPSVILRCASTADVVAAVAHARRAGLVIAVRGGGHSMAGLSTCDDGAVIDLTQMKAIQVDAVRRTATVQPGVIWRELDAATQAHGLAVPGGEVSDTGVAGLTLGGGIGWLGRKHGLSADNLRAVILVTASGEVVRASTDENSELFWGMRGAGANFGIVTELELDLHAVGPTLFGGELIHPGFRAHAALRFLMARAAEVPDDVRLMAALVTAPAAPFVPPEAQGQPVCVLAAAHCGTVEDGRATLERLRDFGPPVVDTLRELTYVELQQTVDRTIPPGRSAYVKSDFLGPLDDEALEVLGRFHAAMPSPHSQILLHQMGGAFMKEPAGGTAYPNRDAAWMLTIAGIWTDPDESAVAHVEWARSLWREMRPWSTGTYVNHLGDEGADRVREAYGASYPRLVALKQQWDPENVFRLNQNIVPPV
jgi:FAD/FMN-containing dehydrogenase